MKTLRKPLCLTVSFSAEIVTFTNDKICVPVSFRTDDNSKITRTLQKAFSIPSGDQGTREHSRRRDIRIIIRNRTIRVCLAFGNID